MPRLITSSTTPPPSLPRTSYGNCFVCIGFNNSGTGLVADVVKEVGSTMAHLEALIPLIKREMRCEEAENQRDAVFCLGLIAEKQPAVVQNQITALLTVPPPPLPCALNPMRHISFGVSNLAVQMTSLPAHQSG